MPRRLFWQALAAFLILPGMAAFVVPWWIHPANEPLHSAGLLPFALGVVGLLWCVGDFYVAGRGTLAPWTPPTRLVTVGLYRFSRNPMYVGVLLILCGWALAYPSRTLWVYAVIVAAAFHLRVLLYEEPVLARMHGAEWTAYRSRVPRWLGLRRANAAGPR